MENLPASISYLGVAGSIGTAIALAALALLIAYGLTRQWIKKEQRNVEVAIAAGNIDYVDAVLERFHVRTEDLTRQQKYDLARQQIRNTFAARLVTSFLVFFAFCILATLAFFSFGFEKAQASDQLSYGEIAYLAALRDRDARVKGAELLLHRELTAEEREFVENLTLAPTSDLPRPETPRTIEEAERGVATISGLCQEFELRDDGYIYCGSGTPVVQLETPNQSSRKGSDIEAVVISWTVSSSAEAVAQWYTQMAAKGSYHLVVGRDGIVIQLAPLEAAAWHLGRPSEGSTLTNQNTIAIGLENIGPITRSTSGEFKDAYGNTVPPSEVTEFNVGGSVVYSQEYTDQQYHVLSSILRAIGARLGDLPVVPRSEARPQRVDPGPAFNFARLGEAS